MNKAVNLWNRHDKFWYATFFPNTNLRESKASERGRTSASSVEPLHSALPVEGVASPYLDKQFSGLWTVVVLLSTLGRYPSARNLNLGDVLFEFVLP
jgi:hypothetical protein